jgi:hypothetical protein
VSAPLIGSHSNPATLECKEREPKRKLCRKMHKTGQHKDTTMLNNQQNSQLLGHYPPLPAYIEILKRKTAGVKFLEKMTDEAIVFASEIDKHFKKRDGFIPQEVLRLCR